MSGIDEFVRLVKAFLVHEGDAGRADAVSGEADVLELVDGTLRQSFCDWLTDRMGEKNPNWRLVTDARSAFHAVTSVASLYEKLWMANPAFKEFVNEPSSDDDEEEEEEEGAEKNRPAAAAAAAAAGVAGSVLATLMEAGDDVGEEVLAEQLGLVKPVQIAARTHTEGTCIECEDRLAVADCLVCGDEFCAVCFVALHRKGKRRRHATRPKPGHEGVVLAVDPPAPAAAAAAAAAADDVEPPLDVFSGIASVLGYGAPPPAASASEFDSDTDFAFRAQFVPLRLEYKERKYLRLLQAQLSVSTYTDSIDRGDLKSNKRVHAQILKICAFLSGLALSCNYEVGQQLITSRQWKKHESFFCQVMEYGRRYKVLNPDRMRTEYGRLMFLMMDASRNEVRQLLGFNVARPLVTVASFLRERGAEAMLSDPLVEIATRAIDQMAEDSDGKKTRLDIRGEVKKKEAAVKALARRFRNAQLTEDEIKWCLYSIGDNRTFLLQHRNPVQRMVRYLKRYFGAVRFDDDEYSLAIYGGTDGSRLTHSHEKQFNYVLQSLTLWREILNDMFRLWTLAEEDMLDPACPYKLEDTGQGLQRVQESPRVAKAMRDLLFRTQTKLGSWVGSSVVHLGDKNVPNALVFLDKYTQVARILSPICLCIDRLPEICEQPKTRAYVDTVFGGVEQCRRDILHDFFRSAFDGSGADNFFDAGSCIDGRLTSAWNWCSHVTEKRFFPVLKLTGFSSFDGDFQED